MIDRINQTLLHIILAIFKVSEKTSKIIDAYFAKSRPTDLVICDFTIFGFDNIVKYNNMVHIAFHDRGIRTDYIAW